MDLSNFNIEFLHGGQIANLALGLSFFVGTLISAFVSRRSFLLFLAAVSTVQGAYYVILPTYVLTSFSVFEKNLEIDGVHIHLMRCFGVFLLAEALVKYRLSNRDTDPTIFTTLVWSKIVVYCLAAINLIYAYLSSSVSKSKSTKWTANELLIGVVILAVLSFVVAGLIQLYRCPSWGGYPEASSRLNTHLRVDYFLTLIGGIIGFALPHWFMSLETTVAKSGHMHLYLVRTFNILFIGNALVMGRAPNFLRDNDKVILLECRIILCVPLIMLMLYAQNWYGVFTKYHVFIDIGGGALWMLNAAFGYWSARGFPKFHSE